MIRVRAVAQLLAVAIVALLGCAGEPVSSNQPGGGGTDVGNAVCGRIVWPDGGGVNGARVTIVADTVDPRIAGPTAVGLTSLRCVQHHSWARRSPPLIPSVRQGFWQSCETC